MQKILKIHKNIVIENSLELIKKTPICQRQYKLMPFQQPVDPIIQRILMDKENTYETNLKLKNLICKYGSEAVDPIISRLTVRKLQGLLYEDFTSDGIPGILLIDAITKLAQVKHAQRLAQMLLWEEIVQTQIRTMRTSLLKALKRVGDASIIPILGKYTQEVKKVKYSDFVRTDYETLETFRTSAKEYYKLDQQDIQETITACQNRN